MKLFVGYSIWNKVDMVVWLLDGIVSNFNPADTELGFIFDTCDDGTVEAFSATKDWWLSRNGFKFRAESWDTHLRTVDAGWFTAKQTDKPIREVGGHNALLKMFLESDCDVALIAQDDQKFERSVHQDIVRLRDIYGDRLGLIGGRDGYFPCFRDMASSEWSESTTQKRLPYGTFAERPYFNSGPVGYPRKLVQDVGLLDADFTAYYIWDDYGARALKAGFQSVVLSMHVKHAKFGRTKATTWVDSSGSDMARLRSKHAGVM